MEKNYSSENKTTSISLNNVNDENMRSLK